jgi:hypothetical protein
LARRVAMPTSYYRFICGLQKTKKMLEEKIISFCLSRMDFLFF